MVRKEDERRHAKDKSKRDPERHNAGVSAEHYNSLMKNKEDGQNKLIRL